MKKQRAYKWNKWKKIYSVIEKRKSENTNKKSIASNRVDKKSLFLASNFIVLSFTWIIWILLENILRVLLKLDENITGNRIFQLNFILYPGIKKFSFKDFASSIDEELRILWRF